VKFRHDDHPYCLSEVIVDEAGIASAQPYKVAIGHPGMKLVFTSQAAGKLRREVAVRDELAFVIDGEPILHLIVMDPIGSEAVVGGDFAESELNG